MSDNNRGYWLELDNLDYDELLVLNERIVERLKFLDRQDAHDAMMQFHPGARVCFESTKHGFQTGTIMKFNQKTVSIVTDDGRRWNVAPQVLSSLKPPASDNGKTSSKESDQPMNVIDIKKKKFEPV